MGEAPFTKLPFPAGSDTYGDVAAIEALAKAIVLPPLGSMVEWAGRGDPKDTKWLAADGRAVSRTTYAQLFEEIVPSLGKFTVTIASPGVFTLTKHGLLVGDQVYLTTTGKLPTGLAINTIYFVSVSAENTFQLALTRGGVSINTSGTQEGEHTCHYCPWGLGNGTTTFNIPDSRGRTGVGPDSMGTTAGAAGRLATVNKVMGASTGTETVTLTIGQIPAHAHGGSTATGATGIESAGHQHGIEAMPQKYAGFGQSSPIQGVAVEAQGKVTSNGNETTHTHSVPKLTITSEGSGESHSNMQPSMIANKIVRVL
jgi:Microcystin-dependent protein